MAKGKVLQTIIDISGEISPTLGKSLQSVEKSLEGVNLKALAVGAAVGGIAIGTGAAVAKAGKYLANLGDEYNSAVNDIAASTGLVGEELTAMGDVLENVYGANFGENMEDVATGLADIYRNTGLVGEELEATTKAAFALSDTFGYDIAESSRAAKAMMTNFGISGEEAMGMIAAGAQNGLDYSGELIDTINEYSVQFSKLGFSADEMFNVLQQGAESGAWNLDKVGDAIKEFSIRSIDGSKTTTHAFESLGLDAEEMMGIFAAGGDDASIAFQGVLTALMGMDDQVQRDAIGVELFGTQWEDLGTEAMSALADINGGAYDAEDALGKINKVKYNNLTDAFEAVKRKGEVALLPLATTIANAFTELAPLIGDVFETIGPIIEQVTADAMPFLNDFLNGIKDVLPVLMPMISDLASAILPLLGEFVQELLPPLLNLVQELLPPMMQIIESLMPSLTEIMLTILPALTELMSAILPVIAELLPPLAEALGIIVGWIAKIVEWVADGLNWVVNLIFGDKSGEVAETAKAQGFATGGFTSGLSIAGEDPRYPVEAVLSFNPAYRQQNLAYWAQAGRMLGADSSDYSLGSTGSGGTTIDMGGVTFAPNITVTGHADKETIMEAIEAEYPEFVDMLEQWLFERGRVTYA